jgi:hypothetical protein
VAPVRNVSFSLLFLGTDSFQTHSENLSMDFDGCLGETILDEQMLDFAPMVALKQYEAVFRGTTASAVSLEFRT